METFLFTSAIKDFARLKRLLPWLLGAVIAVGMAMVWKTFDKRSSLIDVYGQVSFMIVFRLLALASAIFTTAIVSQEVEQKTIVYLLTRPVQRWKVLLSRYVASALIVFGVSAFCALATSIAVFGGGFLTQPLIWADLKALFVGAFAYGAFFLLITLMFNRAMIICLIFAFGWESSVPNLQGEMYYMSIFSYLSGIAQHPAPANQRGVLELLTGQAGVNSLSASTSWGVAIFIVLAFIGISAFWFTHFEYVPREDAE